MSDEGRELVLRLHREAWERLRDNPPAARPGVPRTIDHTELRKATSGPLATEWNFYVAVVGQLIADGKEGKWILIQGEQIIGIYEQESEAHTARLKQFGLAPVLMKQILKQEKLLRNGYNRLQCPS